LLAEFRRAETLSGANRAFSVQKRFELRSAIANGVRDEQTNLFVCVRIRTAEHVLLSRAKRELVPRQNFATGKILVAGESRRPDIVPS